MHLAKPSLSRWRRPAAACLVMMVVLPATRSRAGVVAVQLKRAGSGPPAKTAGGLRVVDGSTAEVMAATSVGARSKAKLGAPAGVEFAVASVARPKGLREAVSDIFRFDGGGVSSSRSRSTRARQRRAYGERRSDRLRRSPARWPLREARSRRWGR